MQYFKDAATGKMHVFDDDVVWTERAGALEARVS